MTITTTELATDTPFGLTARFSETRDGKTWFHLVNIAAMDTTGCPLIIGGKGPARNNYRLVPVTIYRNYRGLATWEPGHPGQDDFAARAPVGYGEKVPSRHLVEIDGALLVRFSVSEVAEWLDDRLKSYARHDPIGSDDDARAWVKKIAPFTTLTDEDVARIDDALDDGDGDDVSAA